MIGSLNVVLIDDNRAWRETLAEFLKDKGFQVQTAAEGRPGLALLESGAAQLAIVDLNMPGMSGLELLRELRDRGGKVTVLVLSSEDDPHLPEQVVEEGARAFLSKTIAPLKLMRSLLQALEAACIEIEIVAVFATRSAPALVAPPRPTHYLPAPYSDLDPAQN